MAALSDRFLVGDLGDRRDDLTDVAGLSLGTAASH
jgi:hypothetical protein